MTIDQAQHVTWFMGDIASRIPNRGMRLIDGTGGPWYKSEFYSDTLWQDREGGFALGSSERRKEINRRRHRKKKMAKLVERCTKATVSEKLHIAAKMRALTLGAEVVVNRMGLEKR